MQVGQVGLLFIDNGPVGSRPALSASSRRHFLRRFRTIREYLERHADFDFDEVGVVNNRRMNIWLYAKCRKYVDPDAAAGKQEAEAS